MLFSGKEVGESFFPFAKRNDVLVKGSMEPFASLFRVQLKT